MLATDLFMLVFRFFHIVAGILWVGSAFLFVAFIGPSAAEVGPSAGPLLSAAVKKRKVTKVITALGGITTLAGRILWLRNWDAYGSLGNWVGSPYGLGITISAVLATIAAFEGSIGVGMRVERLVDLGNEIAASGGPPTPEQQSAIGRLGAELERSGKIDLSCCSSRSPRWRRHVTGSRLRAPSTFGPCVSFAGGVPRSCATRGELLLRGGFGQRPEV